MSRAKFDDTVTGNGNGTITGYDAESGTTATYNPNDPSAGRTNVTDAFTKRDRYRSLGEAAANAKAYQVDFGLAQGDRADGLGARDQQLQAAGLQQQAAMGNAPSHADIMGNQAGGQSLDAALGASANAKPGGFAAAQMAAQRAQAGMQQQAVGQYGGMRAGELADARGGFGNTMTAARQGDYTSMGLSQQQAEAQAQSENAQRGLNQAGQMGFEQLGINSEQQQVNSRLRQMQITANGNEATAQGDAARAQMQRAWAQGTVTSVGVAASDERAKQNSRPMMLSDAAAKANAWDLGHNAALDEVQQMRTKSPEELKALGAKGNRLANALAGAKGDAWDEAHGKSQHIMQGQEMPTREPQAFQHGDPNDMTRQLADGLAPYEYEYKPGFDAAEGQKPGEKNVGPMAQNMAANPVTGAAVSQRPDGLLQIDMKKATKLSLAAAGHNARKLQEQQAQIDALKGGR
jgi:hypothetical protein